MERVYEKLGFFQRIKNRMARGLVLTVVFYLVFLVSLMVTNRTNVEYDVLFLWMIIPAFYLAVIAAVAVELSWSASAYFTKREMSAADETEIQKLKEEVA